eukprot:1430848-Rhodomonas_salina.1
MCIGANSTCSEGREEPSDCSLENGTLAGRKRQTVASTPPTKRRRFSQCTVEDRCLVQAVQSTCICFFRPTSVDSRVTALSVCVSVPPGHQEVAGVRGNRRRRLGL